MNPEGQPWCARSDPRMNRAVEARLQNPSLSLYECLGIGGFDFAADEAHSLDRENVTLAQRKNQLNRRLRTYRKRLSKAKSSMSSSSQAVWGEMKRAPEETSEEIHHQSATQAFSDPLVMSLRSNEPTNLKCNNSLEDSSSSLPRQDEEAKLPGVGSTHPNPMPAQGQGSSGQGLWGVLDSLGLRQAESMAPFSSRQPLFPPGDSTSNNSMHSIYSSLPTVMGGGGGGADNQFLSLSSNILEQQAIVSGLAVNQVATSSSTSHGHAAPVPSSVQSTGTIPSVPVDLESMIQLAIQASSQTNASPQQQPQEPQPDSLRDIASRLVAQFSSGPSESPAQAPLAVTTTVDPRRELALRLFQQEMATVYSRALRTAGYSVGEIEPNSDTYRDFLRTASQQEYQRVQGQLHSQHGLSLVDNTTTTGTIGGDGGNACQNM